ncbi:hypothetical protein GCM10007939_15540 [Amylibacter marinus]|uniref:Tetrapyrrole methylase domain-containing protein n=1 Tax=Amylibacter marinus TaxID=1475483 RepID=A0ABQ5VVL8_9RHOB|nr:precorrin-2 C(20)-methyltransferase [Amylibacter marinus]GLQ35271.1 hypothetical protein GCM10007939_15540 [Amylibacter marinus]
MSGVLYGLGLGPGDPELITLKTVRLIKEADVVAYPALVGGDSFARSIAQEFIPEDCIELSIEIPMAVARAPAQAAYDQGASTIAQYLSEGLNVVVLCEGDPFFYGSFMYLFARLSGEFTTEVIPGVTSISACAAAVAAPLSSRNEVLTILPAPLPTEELVARIGVSDSFAIMKVGRHLPKIKRMLDELGLTQYAHYIERASLPNQVVLPLEDAPEKAPYFSMILVTKGNDPWL